MKTLFVAMLLGSLGCLAIADERVDPKHSKEAARADEHEFVLGAMEQSINQIRRGEVEIMGSHRTEHPERETRETPLRLYSAWDNDQGVLRFDRIETKIYGAESKKGQPSYITTRTGFCRLPDRILDFDRKRLDIRPVNSKPLSDVKPFDVRMFGLYLHSDLERMTDSTLALKALLFMKPETIKKDADNMYVLSWLQQGLQRSLWVDGAHGFTPVRHELRKANSDAGQGDLLFRSSTNWEFKKEVWVPIRATVERRLNVYKGRKAKNAEVLGVQIDSYRFNLSWQEINSKISDKTFSIDGFDLPKGTLVVDSRVDPPITLERYRGIGLQER